MKRTPGFTFVELLVALSLFSIGMISVVQIFPINRRLLNQSTYQTQAVFLAQQEMETIRSLDYTDLTTGTFEPKETIPQSSGTVFSQFQRSTTVTLIDGTYATTNTDVGLKKVAVTVYWTEGSVNRQYTLMSFAHN